MRVAVVGAAGRMGQVVVQAVRDADDLILGPLVDRTPADGMSSDAAAGNDADVIVDFTRPEAAMTNLPVYRQGGAQVIVGTSGFDSDRLAEVRALWEGAPTTCLIVPNFSIGAVLMMKMAREAAPYFQAAEVIELHHDRKVDAPSGTAVATAESIGRAAPDQSRAADPDDPSRGRRVGAVNVHAVRLPGLLAHQEVILGNPGETVTIRHDTSDRQAFVPGILLAIRRVSGLAPGLTVGLEQLL